VKIEIDNRLLEEIAAAELKRTVASLKEDHKKRKAGVKIAIFDLDKAKDMAELKRHIDAFELVLKYYTGV
jgi:hypothetical protein